MPGNDHALPPLEGAPDRRLGSWKEIAAYLGRGVRSVQRWEREEGLPVRRLSHQKRGSVYAYKNELDEWWAGRGGSLATQEPEEDETARRPESAPRFLGAKAAVVAGIALAGVVLYLAIRRAPERDPEMRQLTRNGGVHSQSISLSGDGKIVAFSSDSAEEGNLDIWVQETNGTEARRLTHSPDAELNPSISHDGKNVLFVSHRASGSGIYQIAAVGGQEKLLIPEAEEPRYSSEGKRIAYLSGNQQQHLYVSDSDGTNRREIQTGLAQLAHLVWSPDGKDVMVYGRPSFGHPADWWVIHIGNQESVDTHVLQDLKAYFSSSSRFLYYAQAWLPGRRILFAGDDDGVWSIWQIRLSAGNFRLTGPPERITGRTPIFAPFAVAGNRLLS